MDIKQLFSDDDAVSPVIGVILMVAITVILAAVIGAFVLDIGGSQESAPQVQWEWSDNTTADSTTPEEGYTMLEHGGGDTVSNPSQITLSDSGDNIDSTNDGASIDTLPTAPSGSWSAGSTVHVNPGTGSGVSGTLSLVWESSDGSQSTELSSHDYDY